MYDSLNLRGSRLAARRRPSLSRQRLVGLIHMRLYIDAFPSLMFREILMAGHESGALRSLLV